jgi:hypothetical protein
LDVSIAPVGRVRGPHDRRDGRTVGSSGLRSLVARRRMSASSMCEHVARDGGTETWIRQRRLMTRRPRGANGSRAPPAGPERAERAPSRQIALARQRPRPGHSSPSRSAHARGALARPRVRPARIARATGCAATACARLGSTPGGPGSRSTRRGS